jgi:hypothetical protein
MSSTSTNRFTSVSDNKKKSSFIAIDDDYEEEVSLQTKMRHSEHPLRERLKVQNELKDSYNESYGKRHYEESDEEVKKEKIRKIKKVMKNKIAENDNEYASQYIRKGEEYNNLYESDDEDNRINTNKLFSRSKSLLPERTKKKESVSKSFYENTHYKTLEIQLKDMEDQLRTMNIGRGYTMTHSKSVNYLRSIEHVPHSLTMDQGRHKFNSYFSMDETKPPIDIGTSNIEDNKITKLENKLDKLEKDVSEMKTNFEKLVETLNRAIETNTLGQNLQNNNGVNMFGTGYSKNSYRMDANSQSNKEEQFQYFSNDNILVSQILDECGRMINQRLGGNQQQYYTNNNFAVNSGFSSPKKSLRDEDSYIDGSFEQSSLFLI